MKMIFLGSPGAGKGSLAEKVVDILGVPHISTGRIFRASIRLQTPLGLKVKATIEAGRLVDDETTIELVKERLSQDDAKNGYILDGFPRTLAQAEALCSFSSVDKVIDIDIPDSMVLDRLGGRRVCRKCGHNYHIINDKPKKEGICNHCGGNDIYTRNDDKEEAILERLEIYRAQTAPLIEYYRKKDILIVIDGRPHIEQVVENFKAALGL